MMYLHHLVKKIDTELLLTAFVDLWYSSKIPHNLMRYFDVIFLSDIISSIGPKFSDCDIYYIGK